MKAFLRADPDIIMVGEMRDSDDLHRHGIPTGHLVFATLHTNSAPESIIRLLDMVWTFLAALLSVARLGKRLCAAQTAAPGQSEEIKLLLEEYCQELKNTDSWA